MSLLSALLGFVLRKLGVVLALVVSLFLGWLLLQFLVPAVREAVTDRERLEQVALERAALEQDLARLRRTAAEEQGLALASLDRRIDAELARARRGASDTRDRIADLRADRDEECGLLGTLGDLVLPGSPCESARKAVAQAEAALESLEEGIAEAEEQAAVLGDPDLTTSQKLERLGGAENASLEREIATTESQLARSKAEEASLEETRSSGLGWVVDQWLRSWRWLAAIAVLVLVLPVILRTVAYFVLMPLLRRTTSPIRLAPEVDDGEAEIRCASAVRTLTVDLADGEVLSARSEYVRPVQGRVRSRLLYDWSSPFISYAAGLAFLSRVTGDGGVTSATLASPENPDAYLMRIDFSDHPGLVMRPRHVVGVLGAPEVRTRWRWGLQALATGQVRYVMFAGAGGLIVHGSGDVVATDPRGRSTRMEQHLVMGFDSRLTMGVHRTEVFWPYLRGRTPLVDDEFDGVAPLFWQKSAVEGPRNPLARTFDALFSGLGKLLGF